jgi:cytochrome c biogenesis protein CcdA
MPTSSESSQPARPQLPAQPSDLTVLLDISARSAIVEPPACYRFQRGVAATAGFTFLLAPVTLGAAFFALIAVGTYDTTGRGAPFRGCSAGTNGTALCSEPDVVAVVICVLVILACCLGAGFAGMGVSGAGAQPAQRSIPSARRIHPMARAGWMLTGLSVVFTVVGAPVLAAVWFFL